MKNFQSFSTAGGQWISFHPLPNEDGGLRLWYQPGTLGWRTCIADIATSQAQNRTWTFQMDLFSARFSQSDDYSFCGYLDRYLCASVHFRMLNSGCIILNLGPCFNFSYLHLGHHWGVHRRGLFSIYNSSNFACMGFSSRQILWRINSCLVCVFPQILWKTPSEPRHFWYSMSYIILFW